MNTQSDSQKMEDEDMPFSNERCKPGKSKLSR